MLFTGWMLTEAATERRSMETRINQSENKISALEESIRNLRESQRRLELTVYEMRRERKEQP